MPLDNLDNHGAKEATEIVGKYFNNAADEVQHVNAEKILLAICIKQQEVIEGLSDRLDKLEGFLNV